MSAAYFEELASRLRSSHVPPERVTDTIDDVAAFVAETGVDADEEFGPPASSPTS